MRAGTDYHVHITAKRRWFDLKLGEVWQYRDLIRLLVRRAFTVSYKQTILGPAWLFINPLLSSVVYTVLFGQIAGLGTDGVPQLLFYLTGTAIWSFFSTCLTGNASVFVSNAGLYGKVYFPRLVIPIVNVLTAAVRFGIQMLLVLGILAYYVITGAVYPHFLAWLLAPAILLVLGCMGMGVGIIASSLTTKYRDLTVLVGFCAQLWMYATPVVYPMSEVPGGALTQVLSLNPVASVIELFRWCVLGVGTVQPGYLLYGCIAAAALLLAGLVLFNRIEKNFMDTV